MITFERFSELWDTVFNKKQDNTIDNGDEIIYNEVIEKTKQILKENTFLGFSDLD